MGCEVIRVVSVSMPYLPNPRGHPRMVVNVHHDRRFQSAICLPMSSILFAIHT